MIFSEIMAFKRKSQTQYSGWKSGTSLSGKNDDAEVKIIKEENILSLKESHA